MAFGNVRAFYILFKKQHQVYFVYNKHIVKAFNLFERVFKYGTHKIVLYHWNSYFNNINHSKILKYHLAD